MDVRHFCEWYYVLYLVVTSIWSCVKSPGKEILWKTVAPITLLSENAEKFNVFVAAKNLHISTLQWQIQKQHKFRVGYFISSYLSFFSSKNFWNLMIYLWDGFTILFFNNTELSTYFGIYFYSHIKIKFGNIKASSKFDEKKFGFMKTRFVYRSH